MFKSCFRLQLAGLGLVLLGFFGSAEAATQGSVVKTARKLYTQYGIAPITLAQVQKLNTMLNPANFVNTPANFTQAPGDIDDFMQQLVKVAEDLKPAKVEDFSEKLKEIEDWIASALEKAPAGK